MRKGLCVICLSLLLVGGVTIAAQAYSSNEMQEPSMVIVVHVLAEPLEAANDAAPPSINYNNVGDNVNSVDDSAPPMPETLAVPEPSTLLLFGMGILCIIRIIKWKKSCSNN